MKKPSKKSYGCGTTILVFIILSVLVQYAKEAIVLIIMAILVYFSIKWIKKLLKKESKKPIHEEKKIIDKNSIKENLSVGEKYLVLSGGRYLSPRDIEPGIYDIEVLEGSGVFETDFPEKISEFLNYDEPKERNYKNIEITNDTVLKIDVGVSLKFYNKRNRNNNYKKSSPDISENDSKGNKKLNDEIRRLNGLIEDLKICLEEKQEEINKINHNIDDRIAKRYEQKKSELAEKVKIDLHELLEKRMTEQKLFYKYKGENEALEKEKDQNKRNIDVLSKEIQKLKNEYDERKDTEEKEFSEKHSEYLERYNEMQSEIEAIRDELKILNDEAIKKYYLFSDYEDLNSEECKNQLSILKTREKELRESEKDVRFEYDLQKKKIQERCTRQILRNFNSDCDNIMSNISVKNIDLVRNRIQKSYETLNKLYSIDGISLTNTILKLKLEQATLLYTYELKKQQEKDIQQAIKEQMLEEAKAQKEIEEQKQKIEKDLQQHLSEVNRMMKYMQKTQIDAEKQLYIDKIKELEDKIKELEADKETVMEREANAKAGFVYIISNIGSFGQDIYKIGMTRRLEPMERIRELSSASVPFEFDVHAMIFSSDAPDLENTLHKHFADKAVNKVNPRKEFYKVDIDEIEKVVKENYNDTVQFTKIPVAAEFRRSIEMLD